MRISSQRSRGKPQDCFIPPSFKSYDVSTFNDLSGSRHANQSSEPIVEHHRLVWSMDFSMDMAEGFAGGSKDPRELELLLDAQNW